MTTKIEGVDPESPPACVACPYDPEPCDVPYLRGLVIGLDENACKHGPQGRLFLHLEDGHGVELCLSDQRWQVLLPQLKRVLNQIAASPERLKPLAMVAYHLKQAEGGVLTTGAGGIVILEPDWLINVTDLTELEYCPRQHLVNRFGLSPANIHLLRGNILHQVFEQILQTPADQPTLTAALKEAFFSQARQMAFLELTKAGVWEQVKDPYRRLQAWARRDHRPGQARSESFLLAPQLGLKGKIDALWSKDGRVPLIAELKTGRSMGPKSKPGHAFQAAAYSLMTGARDWRPPNQKTLLLYSGNPEQNQQLNIERSVPVDLESLRQVIYQRNQLVLSDYLLDAPYETRQPNKCIQCSAGVACAEVGFLLGHDDPRPPAARWTFNPEASLDEPEKAWFRQLADLLLGEFRAVKSEHALLWQLTPAARVEAGRSFVASASRLVSNGNKPFVYHLEGENLSELREGDFILASDGRGPGLGAIAQGLISRSLENGLEISFSEPLDFEPRIVDSYVSENLVERQFAGLFAWLSQPGEYRDLVTRQRWPRFDHQPVEPHFPPVVNGRPLNPRQIEVIQKALQMQDYLLVLGPPGAGKTTLIAALVRELIERGQRVLLTAGTNTALDNLLKPLLGAGLDDQVLRLGVEGRTDPDLKAFLPEALAADLDLDTHVQKLRQAFADRRVVGATATTWLSSRWEGLPPFDVAIVDEAAQLTQPAALGALRLAKRFILIGDHKQLPAVVISETRSGPGKADPETPRLSVSLFEALYKHCRQDCPQAIVNLNEQYRMNAAICAIPRQLWYNDDLKPATPEVAQARLPLIMPLERGHLLFPLLAPQYPVIFYHLPWTSSPARPRASLVEARAITEILKAYFNAGLAYESVGVIAPFRAQVALIRHELSQHLGEAGQAAARDLVDTVDRFQGQERDLVIISLAVHGPFIHDLLQDERRLNVAITRARHKLVILGDQDILNVHPLYQRLLTLCNLVVAA